MIFLLDKNLRFLLISGLLTCLLLVSTPGLAEDFPTLKGYVTDLGDMLSDGEENTLSADLKAYEDTTSNQFAILTIASLNGYDVSDYAWNVAEQNGIGQKGKDNGLLILVAREEHKISIQIGYGLEAVITDGQARLVIENYLTPAFRNNNYYKGLADGILAMQQMAAGEFKADEKKKDNNSGGGSGFMIFIVLIIFLSGIFRRKGGSDNFGGKGKNRTLGRMLPWLILGSLGSGGSGGGGGSFGGGFGGFGGGSFGGGGASGGW